MNILYLPCHSILEYDETKLLTEMGHTVLSLGSYLNPNSPVDVKRPSFKTPYLEHLNTVALQCSKDNLHPELIEWADVILDMHIPEWLINNWGKIKHKRVIWRSIGQSAPHIENQLTLLRSNGLQIVRYSPKEQSIEGYIGHDAIIRFYKDEDEFTGYTGEITQAITVAQSMLKRKEWCHYDVFEQATSDVKRVLYGPDNESPIWGGLLSYDELKRVLRKSRLYFYTGTYPASYTLGFIEAMMTGIPIVAIGNGIWNINLFKLDTYEVPEIIQHGVNGFVSDNIFDLKMIVNDLIEHPTKCMEIGANGRRRAIELFGKQTVKKQWEAFL